MNEFVFDDFPVKTYDKVRYADTDRQGHVNNAVFSSFLETGRVEILYNTNYSILTSETSFVIASLKLNFVNEINWPGNVDIGTGILQIGNSSMVIYQMLFQNNMCVAKAETTIVQINTLKKISSPLTAAARETLKLWLLKIG